jgi:hypothetical protein
MKFKVTPTFAKALKRFKKKYRNLDQDINHLRSTLIKNPEVGISLGVGL